MSFEAYDDRGVVDAPSRRVPNRAMAQGAEADVRGTPARDAGSFERWETEKANERARSPSNSDRRRVERGAAEELRRTDPRAGSALGSTTRRAVIGATETALLPYRGARALSGGRLPELSAEEAYAQAESLARDEPVAATRERQSVQDRAHPDARNIGDAAGQVADPFLAAEAMKGGLRLRALGGVRGSAPAGEFADAGERGFAAWRPNKVESEAEKVLGTPSPDAHRLVGSPRFATESSTTMGSGGKGIEVRASGRAEGEAVSNFRRDDKGRLVVEDNYLEVPELARQEGQGREIMANKLREYDRLGAERLEFEADYDGRYVWPHLGYQTDKATLKGLGKRFNEHLESIGEDPIKVRRIQDISEHPEGREFLLDSDTERFPMHLDLRSKEADALRKRLGVNALSRAGQRAAGASR